MKAIRWALLPFSLLYGAVTSIRNWLFDKGWKSSYAIPGKSIVVGNLSVGGTGKSPLVIYLIQHFLNENTPVATLSRGYGRKTKGLVIADSNSDAAMIGDEPLQYVNRFGDAIRVTVAEERKIGITYIRKQFKNNPVIVLDDAFQHRKVKAGLNILVTEYHRPYVNDFLLPVGKLRESKSGVKRADIILVSKCPEQLSDNEKVAMAKKLAPAQQPVFFSTIQYGDLKPISGNIPKTIKHLLLVTGIGNSKPLEDHLKSTYSVKHLKFPDHHDFTASDIDTIHQNFNTFASRDKIIVTTEKDYMRLQQFEAVIDGSQPWFYQPIEIAIEKETQLKNLLKNYVREN